MTLTLDIFIHLEAVDRNAWQGLPDDRPLTDIGAEQADRVTDALNTARVDAIFSSPVLRCRQSVEPLAILHRLPIEVTLLTGFALLQEVYAAVPNGRAVLCTTGDVVPPLMATLGEAWGVPVPPRDTRRGVVFSLTYDGSTGTLSSRDLGVGS